MARKLPTLLFATLLLSTAGAEAITLEEAVKTALERNNTLKAKRIELEEKKYELREAKARLYPKLELFSEYNKTTDPPYSIMDRMEVKKLNPMETDFNDPGKYQLFRTGLRAQLPIWMGGKLRIAVNLTDKEVKATKEQLKKSENDVIFDVVKAYYNALTAKAFIETAELAVKDAQRHLKDAQTVYEAGLGLKSDVLRAKVYLEQAEEGLVKAKSNYQIALRALSVAMGAFPKGELPVEGELTYREFDFNLDSLISTAVEKRPEIKELSVRQEQSKDMEKLAFSDFLPQVGAFGEIFMADDTAPWNKENSSWTVGVSATVNLFSGGEKFYRLRKSRLASLKVKEYKEQAKKGIAFEVSKAYYEFLSARKRVELARAALSSAQESLRIVEKRYRNGVANITELLDTQTALNQARSNFVAALSAYRMAVASIYHATGELPTRYRELVDE